MSYEITSSVRPDQLEAEIIAAHGWRKAPGLSVRQPGQVDNDGQALPGVVVVGRDDADPVVVQAALAAHVPDPAWVATPEEANARTIDARLLTALDQLRTFITASKPSTAAAQASAAYDAARLCARVLVGLVRLHLRRLEDVE